jgi:hypothetical protein
MLQINFMKQIVFLKINIVIIFLLLFGCLVNKRCKASCDSKLKGQNKSEESIRSEVKVWQGTPTLYINGEPVYSMLMMPAPFSDDPEQPFRDFASAGVHLYSDIVWVDTGGSTPAGPDACELIWNEDGSYDFSKIDRRMQKILDIDPEGLVMLRLKMDMPSWWLDRYPDDHAWFIKDGVIDDSGNFSLASVRWLEDARKLLKDIIGHVEQSDYANHVFGYHIGGGRYSEWYWHGGDKGSVDYSPAAEKSFRKWLRNKYDDIGELREAWNSPGADFDQANIIPSEADRRGDSKIFLDPSEAGNVADYRAFMADCISNAVIELCKVVKDKTDGRKIAGAFGGYSLTNSAKAADATGFNNLQKILESPDVDFVCSPTTYERRRGGDDGNPHVAYLASIRLHGKMFFDEADYRTHLTEDTYENNQLGRTSSLQETLEVFNRSFGYTLTRGTGMWWFLLAGNETFSEDVIMQNISKMVDLGKASIAKSKASVAEVAMVVDEASMNWYSSRNDQDNFLYALQMGQLKELAHAGAPFDVILSGDLMRDDLPDYKVYLFPNLYAPTFQLRNAIEGKVKRNGSIAVWMYAPGILNNDWNSGEGAIGLTGIRLRSTEVQTDCSLAYIDLRHPIAKEIKDDDAKDRLKQTYEFAPAVWAEDINAQNIATWYGRTILAIKEFDTWSSIYSTLPLTRELLQGIYNLAGVHSYSKGGDVLFADSTYVMLHTSTAGEKTITLPAKYHVHEILSDTEIGWDVDTIRGVFPEGVTRLWQLDSLPTSAKTKTKIFRDNNLKVYPNPFNNRVTFEFTPKENSRAVLEIYDMLGQKITTLLDKPLKRGMLNRIEYVPAGATPGVLTYRLILGNIVNTGRVIRRANSF